MLYVELEDLEAKGLLSSLGIERPLNKIPLFQVTFCCNSVEYKMNEIITKFLLVKFIPEIHLKQPRFTYIACGPFTKNKERIQKFMQTGNTGYIYKNDLDKARFQHNVANGE